MNSQSQLWLPVYGGCPSMERKYGGMIADRFVSRVVDHIHGYELGAERQHVQLGAHTLVSFQHLGDRLSFLSPRFVLEHRHPILVRHLRCNNPMESHQCRYQCSLLDKIIKQLFTI